MLGPMPCVYPLIDMACIKEVEIFPQRKNLFFFLSISLDATSESTLLILY